MKVVIHSQKKFFDKINAHLREKKTEQVAFLFLSGREPECSSVYGIEDYYLVPSSELIFESPYYAEVSEEIQAKVIKMAWDKGICLGEVHSHPLSKFSTKFSPSDLTGFEDFVPHIWWRLKGKPYFSFVFGPNDFDALAWKTSAYEPEAVEQLVIGGKVYLPTGLTIRAIREEKEKERVRYSRQTAFWGLAGQKKIEKMRVAIVGLGGLGSHVAQYLAHLGVQQYYSIDHDHVDQSSLNRMIGALESDIGLTKVSVVSRLVRSIQKNAKIVEIENSLVSEKSYQAIREANFVFGCIDNDAIRLVLLELCCFFKKPFLDLASEIHEDGTFGGRAVFTGLGKGCLVCHGILDQSEIRRFFSSEEQQIEEEKIYGVNQTELEGTGPSVVTLNGLIAYAAGQEFLAYVTGVRPPQPYLTYRGNMATLHLSKDPPTPGCYYCEGIWNGRENADYGRYLKGP